MKIVYALVDPRRPMIVRYIGCSVAPDRRLREHIAAANDHNHGNDAWISSLLGTGREPWLRVLEAVADDAMALDREAFWISVYRSPRLLNFGLAPRAFDEAELRSGADPERSKSIALWYKYGGSTSRLR
jgi:hypothetical protein